MITRLTVRCWHCDVERVYPIPGDFSDVIIEMEIYHSVCGRKMDYWTEEVDLIMWNSGTAKESRTKRTPAWLLRLRRRPTMPVTMGQMISLWEQAVLDGDHERAADIRKEMVKIMRDMEKEAESDA